MTHLTVISKTKKLKMVRLTNVTLTWAARSSTMNLNKNLFPGTVHMGDYERTTVHNYGFIPHSKAIIMTWAQQIS